ncbi:MAG: tRNA (adenosine(37)-N6)-threonylcarbamoyltransferase complex ATPase subunit type 1 TsaE [Casimicrobiaceae bacterium]
MTDRYQLDDIAATERAGAALAGAATGGMVIALRGDLGAGKTTLVRGALRGVGWTGPVKSPTYTLVEHYPLSSLYFYHFDFYRFTDPTEWETAGLAECFRPDSVCLVEWPERIGELLPQPDLDVALSPTTHDGARVLELHAHTPAGRPCVAAVRAAGLVRATPP